MLPVSGKDIRLGMQFFKAINHNQIIGLKENVLTNMTNCNLQILKILKVPSCLSFSTRNHFVFLTFLPYISILSPRLISWTCCSDRPARGASVPPNQFGTSTIELYV